MENIKDFPKNPFSSPHIARIYTFGFAYDSTQGIRHLKTTT